jgi:hypothetical protein
MSVVLLFDGKLLVDITHQYFPSDVNTLCDKLAQYPSGTKVQAMTFGKRDQLIPMIRLIKEVAVERGLFMEIAP